MKLEVEVVELKNLAEGLRADIVEKDTQLDHLQKQNEELRSSYEQAKDEVIKEFKLSKAYIDLLDTNYAAGFEDFRMDMMERFSEVDFPLLSLILVLQVLYSRRVLKMSTLKTMLQPSLLITTLPPEKIPLSSL